MKMTVGLKYGAPRLEIYSLPAAIGYFNILYIESNDDMGYSILSYVYFNYLLVKDLVLAILSCFLLIAPVSSLTGKDEEWKYTYNSLRLFCRIVFFFPI